MIIPRIYKDEQACQCFVKLMGDHIKREGKNIYYFNPNIGVWETGEVAFFQAVSRKRLSLLFHVDTRRGERIDNYGGDAKNVLSMKKWLNTYVPDRQFITDNISSSYGKLHFRNGTFDFITNTFTEGFDPNNVFNIRISRKCPLPSERNEELIAKVEKMLFRDPFDEKDGAGLYLKKALCMGLVGDCTRQKFYTCLGDTNCGKSLTTIAFREAFDEFVKIWDGNELKYHPRCKTRKMDWLTYLRGSRLVFSNGFRVDKIPLDGNLVKVLAKHTTMFLMVNTFGNITPKDSEIQEHCRFIPYDYSFVDEIKRSNHRPKDPEAKHYFSKTEYKDALFWVMVDTYQSMQEEERKRGGKIIEPEVVIEETKDWVGDEVKDFENFINCKYEITGNPTDSVPTKDIINYIINECCMYRLSSNKIGRMISKLIEKVNKQCPRDKKHKLGIKYKATQ